MRQAEAAFQPDTTPSHPGPPSSSLEPRSVLLGGGRAGSSGQDPAPYTLGVTQLCESVGHYCLCIIDSYCTLQAINY